MKKSALAVFCGWILAACAQDPQTATATDAETGLEGESHAYRVNNLDVKSKTKINFKLSKAKGIAHEVYRYKIKPVEGYRMDVAEQELFQYQIVFPNLTQKEFETLKSAYGNQSKVKFAAGTAYYLQDFLHPSIQATIGKHFLGQSIPLTQQSAKIIKDKFNAKTKKQSEVLEDSVQVYSNCTSTAFEVLRNAPQGYTLFNGEAELIFNNAKYFKHVIAPKPMTQWTEFGKLQTNLKTYDVLYFFNPSFPNSFDHTTLFIDKGIFFEKSNPDSNASYRFVLDTHYASRAESDKGSEPSFGVKRMIAALPSPEEALSSKVIHGVDVSHDSDPLAVFANDSSNGLRLILHKMKTFKYHFDKLGRATLEPKAFQDKTFGGVPTF